MGGPALKKGRPLLQNELLLFERFLVYGHFQPRLRADYLPAWHARRRGEKLIPSRIPVNRRQLGSTGLQVSEIEWLVADGSELAHKAIGYLLSHKEVSCVIPGIRTQQQLESDLAAAACRVTVDEKKKLQAFWEALPEMGSKLIPW